jgi:tetratricopeptide (TPR) repeat protein
MIYYRRLAKEFPDSIYAAESARAVADEAYAGSDYAEAQKQYELAVRLGKDPAQLARIHQKLAWCYYRQRRNDRALESMKHAIELAKSSGGEKFLSIREEGLRDIAVFYAELGREQEAIDFFNDNAGGQDKLVKVLEKLGREFERKGETESAKKIFQVLLKADPRDESVFRVQARMIDLDISKAKFDAAYERMKAIEIPSSKDPDTFNAASMLRSTVVKTAVANHERYRKLTDKQEAARYLVIAEQYYSIYLSKFLPDEKERRKERTEYRMYLAEAKSDLGKPA